MELKKCLQEETVADVGFRSPLIVRPETSIERTIDLMQTEKVGCVLVVDTTGLCGIFTERDVLKRVLHERRTLGEPVRTVMTSDPLSARPQEPISVVLNRMHAGGHRHLPVVDDAGRPLGTISVKRVVQFLSEHFPAAIYNLPPEPKRYGDTREGA